ncbi:MAG: glycosyltransferase, partial [Chitinophagales bacterium]|nr:glycosyltransferase [Chitinophagales bacterium]
FVQQVNNRNERFTIRYVGNLLASQKAPAFWRAAARMHHENKIDFLIEIIGRADNSVIEEVRKNHLEKIVCVKGFESHIKAIEAMCAADALLFIVPDVVGNEKIITGKILEYLAAEKPIIAIGNRAGDAAYLLRECSRDEMCDYADEEQIFNYLKNFYAHFLKGERKPVNKHHTIFSRKMQTHQLAQILSVLQ